MSTSAIRIEPFYLEGHNGQLFCIHLSPSLGTIKGTILYLHPFAEEMHKSRRMAALQSRALASAGYEVLQIDLTGCGDSSGDFADATWSAWLDDAGVACAWLREKSSGPLILWGLRTGALLAVDLAQVLPSISQLLLWQPVTDGNFFLNQFLRIKLASEMLSEGQSKSGTKELLTQLKAGAGVEVGGYLLKPEMAGELGNKQLSKMTPSCLVTWFEISRNADDSISPASQRVLDGWRTSGVRVQARIVKSDPFWLTQEITECPELIDATLRLLSK
jgi:exosortase A-associated hydrolase 2